jgi:hypothetical protein
MPIGLKKELANIVEKDSAFAGYFLFWENDKRDVFAKPIL